METKIPKTKQEAFAQLDEILSEKEKNELVKGDAVEFSLLIRYVDSKQLDL